jgi:ribosome-binding protein aMBF1 (putative translation factor)
MSKAHRGTGVRNEPNHGRGVCGLCGKSQIKVLYDHEVDGQKVKICKFCKAALKNKAQKAAKLAKQAAPAEESASTEA